jgi:hypothetical protein
VWALRQWWGGGRHGDRDRRVIVLELQRQAEDLSIEVLRGLQIVDEQGDGIDAPGPRIHVPAPLSEPATAGARSSMVHDLDFEPSS